ncbi:ATPase [Simiduia sp. 21SJ11W-1]|uniref:N-acetylglucosamine kinase n=1 Tax=Simiduia sp. 21SJ11W-1 TaxID=2909669 RepID=UPI00209CE121|nr:BadF/BadG/BcrA/BcrD ATPase family protein [Simiduia sp. 21SJ11W-1]UTA49665.1 ATPase [Simiduia sp. 21SJ11W-1]
MYLGIDGGGSKTKAILVNEANEVIGTGLAGPSNPLHGVEQAFTSIRLSAELALEDAGLPRSHIRNLIVGAGLAGVNLPDLYQVVDQWEHPFADFFLTTDLHIACLGAHGGGDGAVIITGTGSCGYSNVKNRTLIVGAHGFPFGDKGSGAWMGLEALKYALLSSDGLAPQSPLQARVEQHLDAKGIDMVGRMATATSSRYARLAPLVLELAEAGDPVSLAIAKDGANYISQVAEKLLAQGPERLSMLGGLAPRLQQWMAPEIVVRLSEVQFSPEFGALLYAKQQLKQLVKTA